jgi:hypothetical protein
VSGRKAGYEKEVVGWLWMWEGVLQEFPLIGRSDIGRGFTGMRREKPSGRGD